MPGFNPSTIRNLAPEEILTYVWLEGEEVSIEVVDRLLEETEYEMEEQSKWGCDERIDEAFEEGREKGEKEGRADERFTLFRQADKLRAAADDFIEFVENRK